ncbi:hypothetical protein CEQ90_04145 [Lewinellaceae bacterium SD302]|nr:hypothetical protein CEQ90_04145 [Lewinellaceae bacterium SD302]
MMINLSLAYCRYLAFIFLLGFIVACVESASVPEINATKAKISDAVMNAPKTEANRQARAIIEAATAAAGLEGMDEAAFAFRFRDKEYRYQRTDGTFTYERWWTDSTTSEVTRDVLDNDGLVRYINGQVAEITEKKRKAYSNSVNSVIYFAFLPWVLNDPAVIPTYLGRDTVKGEILDQIDVAFTTDNGGEDANDEYMYWFTLDTRQLKYLAYSHPDGKAPRLREAKNERRVDGIVVRDYNNWNTPGNKARPINELPEAFEAGELNLLSEINLKDVRKLEVRKDQ